MAATAEYLASHPFASPDIVNPPEAPTYRYRPDIETLVDFAAVETADLSAGSRIDIVIDDALLTYVLQAGIPTGSVLEVVPDDYDGTLNEQFWLLVSSGSTFSGTIDFSEITGTISLDQLPPGSVARLDSISEDALYFFDNSTGLPKLVSSAETVAFISPNLNFTDIQGTISIDQFPPGSVAELSSIDEDALYFFDNAAFVPELIGKADSLAFLLPDQTGNDGFFLQTNAGVLSWTTSGGSGTWGGITGTLSDQTDLQAALDAKQPLDSDLTTIAGLTATTDNFIVSVSSAWSSRTPTQVKTTLGLVIGTNVQAWDADLDTLAGLTATTNNFIVSVSSAWASRTPTQVKSTLAIANTDVSGLGTASTLASDTDGTLATNSDARIATQKAVKTYVDGINTTLLAAIAALDSKDEVAYCSTSALPTCTYSNGSSGVGATLTATTNGPLIVDSATIVVGAVGLGVLVAGQASDFQNGWYTITQQGVVAVSPWILTRRTPDDQASEIGPGYLTAVEAPTGLTSGSANNQKVFLSIAPTPFVVGTDSLTFAMVGGTYTAGNGLSLSGTAFSINTSITADLSTAQSFTNKKLGSLTSNGFVKTGSGDGTLSVDTASYQPLDSDLTTIAGLTATTDNFIVSVSSAWASRTPTQVKTTLGLVIGTNVQAWDADLDTLAGLTATTDNFIVSVASAWASRTPAQVLSTLAAVGTTFQPLDSDLTTIAGLTATTDNFIVSVSSAWASRTPAQVRTTLGLVIGTNVQAWDADLDTLAGLTATTDNFVVSVSSAWASRTPAQVKTTLGLVIGTNVQAWDADLDTLAGLTATTDNFVVSVSSAWASRTPAQVRTTLGLVIGTNVQAWDADLDTWAGVTPASNMATFIATPSSANLRSTMTDEIGTGACVFDGATLTLLLTLATCGSSLASINFPAGTVPTTPNDGDMFADANCFYGCTDAGNPGVVPIVHIIRADSTVTQANDANAHAIFTTPTNGRLTLETGCYRFKGVLSYSSMSATSGNIKIDILGAGGATAGAWLWLACGQDQVTGGGANNITGQMMVSNTSSASIVSAGTATACQIVIEGTFEVTGAGTIIPTQTVATAAAAVLAIGSFIEFWRVGSTSMTSVGQWD